MTSETPVELRELIFFDVEPNYIKRIPTTEEARASYRAICETIKGSFKAYHELEENNPSDDFSESFYEAIDSLYKPIVMYMHLCVLDSYLCQKVFLPVRNPERDQADFRCILEGETREIYMSDDGYSRIYMDMSRLFDNKSPLFLTLNSRDEVKEQWETLHVDKA